MQVMASSIDSLLEEISGVEDPTEELQSLKTALLSIPVSALRDSVSGQRFNVIFTLLSSNQRLASTHLTFIFVVSLPQADTTHYNPVTLTLGFVARCYRLTVSLMIAVETS